MDEKDAILIVDDDPNVRQLLIDILSDDHFQVLTAESGEKAIRVVEAQVPKLILLDINMPVMDGFEVCRRLKAAETSRDIPVVFVSGVQDHREKMMGFTLGAVDFISKPFQPDELLARVHTHVELSRLRVGLEAQVAVRTEELRKSFETIRKVLNATVQTIVTLVEARDPYTAGHQQRVTELVRAIAAEMKLSEDQIDGLRMASLIHDLGKISIPVEILNMPRKLTDIEFMLIKAHPQSGHDILRDIEFPWPVARMILEHHERVDGSGYPAGRTGETLLLESQILAVADVVEAMASHRPYRPALGVDAALEEVTRNRSTLFNPLVVDACLRLFREKCYRL